jgi:hypothetical protein
MTNAKISALTGATTPLAGTETLPVVQGGVTKKVSVANLTLGRAVNTAGGTFTDNQTQGTAAKGINFTANTPAAGMTSQLLNWYEEGTFTPYWSSDTGGEWAGKTTSSGFYTRIGRVVHIYGTATYSSKVVGAAGTIRIRGFPFTPNPSNIGAPELGYGNVIPDSGNYKIRISGTDLLFYAAGTLQGNALIALMPASGTYQFNFCITV